MGRRQQDQSGAISIMAAVMALAMVMATSLAVDVGRVAYTSRDQQGATDRAVLDALRKLPELHAGATGPDDVWDGVRDEILESLDRNEEGSSVGTSSERTIDLLEVGHVDPSTDAFHVMWRTDPDETAGDETMVGMAGADAGDWTTDTIDTIRLSTHSDVDFLFGVLAPDGGRDVYRQALGTTDRKGTSCPSGDPMCVPTSVDAEATISVGSRLVEFDSTTSDILGPVLAGLFGTGSNVTFVGYDGLATADVPLGALADLDGEVGTVDSLLGHTDVTLAEFVTLTAAGLDSDETAATAWLNDNLVGRVAADLTFDIEDILVATTEDPSALLDAQVPLMDLLVAGAMAARAADGEHLLSIDIAADSVLGLLDAQALTLSLRVLEAPQFAHGRARWVPANDADGDGLIEEEEEAHYETHAETAQIELSVDLTIEKSDLDSQLNGVGGVVTDAVDTLLGDLLDSISCLVSDCDPTVRVSLTGAAAEAALTSIDCQQPAEDTHFSGLVSSEALSIDADVGLLNGSILDDAAELLVSGPITVSGVSESEVHIAGVPGRATVSGGSTLGGVAVVSALGLDTVLAPVLGMLGIQLGTGHMGVHAVRCDVPVLLPNPQPSPTASES